MTITIYTDAAWHIRRGAAFAFVAYIGRKRYQHAQRIAIETHSPTEAELMAFGHAIHFIASKVTLTAEDIIIIHTDCQPAIEYQCYYGRKNARLRAIANINRTMTPAHLRAVRAPEELADITWCHKNAKRCNL